MRAQSNSIDQPLRLWLLEALGVFHYYRVIEPRFSPMLEYVGESDGDY